MQVRRMKTTEYTMDELQKVVRAGAAAEQLAAGTQIMIKFDGKFVPYDVIGIDAEDLVDKNLKHSLTIQAHVLVEERPFDTTGRYGSNVWETSELRKYLNSEEYAKRYEDLVPYLAAVRKKNKSGEDTIDTFFLLSREEYGDVIGEETPYEYYKAGEIARVKADENGETGWHWTRSAYGGTTYGPWSVTSSGHVSGSTIASYANRFAQACAIA
jgi:hypothetical protein